MINLKYKYIFQIYWIQYKFISFFNFSFNEQEPDLRVLENSAQIFNALSDIPGEVDDVDKLFEVAFQIAGSLTDMALETHRRKHLAYLMADQGALLNPENAKNLPKQVIIVLW